MNYKLINRHEKCWGIVLFKWRQKFIQLWYCPAGYNIQPHSHPEEDIELMYIAGTTTFTRVINLRAQSFTPKWYHIFQTFSVKAGTYHYFKVSKWPLIFINFSTFKKGFKPKSAAIDFKT